MLSASPDRTSAASPPGAPSSQSSSAGSCYTSSSSQSSARARHTLSDPSSSSTSPASAFDRSSDYQGAPAPAKRPSNGGTSAHTNHSFSAFAAQQTGLASSGVFPHNASAACATMNPHSTAYEAMDPRAYLRAGPSSRAHPDAASPSSNEPRYAHGGSPDNSRAPAAKTRRTSPGGSRASGNLAPSHYDRAETTYSEYIAIAHDTNASSSDFASSNASTLQPSSSFAPMDWTSEAGAAQAPRRAASPGDRRPSASHMPTSNATTAATSLPAASPRTRPDAQSYPAEQFATSTSGVQAPASTSSRASASSSADRAETKSHPPMPKMDLATFPPQELLKILATLLQEIASANDDFQPDGSKDESSRSRRGARTRDRSTPATPAEASESHDPSAARDYAAPPGSHLSFNDSRRPSVTTAALGALATPSSTLCFHARNVPSISIESYLLRILKYCPTTNEVFLSLLVYFDRMSRMGTGAKPGANGGGEAAGKAAGLPRAMERATGLADAGSQPCTTRSSDGEAPSLETKAEHGAAHPGIRGFAIDSYNVHRLVIAGVTVASKFFSDVFYTNSRYAKVGGLPPHELNQLELQFLLLNDFRLTIPLEEMQRYADQLLMYGSGRAELARSTKQNNPAGSLGGRRPSASASTGEPVPGRPSTSAVGGAEQDSAAATLQTAGQARPTDEARVDTQGDVQMSDVRTS